MAVAYVQGYFDENPDDVLPLPELRGELEITNASNFNRRVRNHPDFKTALDDMQIEEVSMGAAKYPNALAKIAPAFSPIPGSNYIADV